MITLILWLVGLAFIYWVCTMIPFITQPFLRIILIVLIITAVWLVLKTTGLWDKMLSMPAPHV